MKSLTKTRILSGLSCLAVLAACDTAHETAKSAPVSALECRQEIYENPTQGQAVIATGGGLSVGCVHRDCPGVRRRIEFTCLRYRHTSAQHLL